MNKVKVLTETISQQFHEYEIEIPNNWNLQNLTEENYTYIKEKIISSDKKISFNKNITEQFCEIKDIIEITSPPELVKIEIENLYGDPPLFTVHNSAPTYLRCSNIITKKTADLLIDIVNKKGKVTEWSYNPSCLEYQIGNPFSKIRNIHDKDISSILVDLAGIADIGLRQVNWAFKNSSFEYITGHHGFWILKYLPGGTFDMHCDQGSEEGSIDPPVLATMSVLLNDDFTGGDFILYDSNGHPSYIDNKKEKYSATIWDGLTYHKAMPVIEGNRYVLIIHYVGNEK